MDEALARTIVAAVDEALRAGGRPPNAPVSHHERKAVATAAEALGVHRTALARPLGEIRDTLGLEPVWSLAGQTPRRADLLQAATREPDTQEHHESVLSRDGAARLKSSLTW